MRSKSKLNQFKSYLSNLNSLENNYSNRYYLLFFLSLIVLAIIPLLYPKIICNDELQTRIIVQDGIFEYFKYYLHDQIYSKGRALSSFFFTLNTYIGFIGIKLGFFKFFQVFSILLCSYLFSVLLFKLTNNKYFSIFIGLLTIVLLPISYEPVSPNSYATQYNFAFALLIFSFIKYYNFLEKDNKKDLFWSMFSFLIALPCYEVFITYTPFFYVLLGFKIPINKKNIKVILKKALTPSAIALAFLITYVIFSKLFPSQYNGNQIGGFTILSSFQIIKQLFLSSFPGYFVFNAKYRYLFKIFTDGLHLWELITIRSILVAFLLVTIYCFYYKKITDIKFSKKVNLRMIGITLFFIVVPTLPWSVSKMYQGIVNSQNFIALPVSFFLFFASVFLISYLFLIVFKNKKSKLHITITSVFLFVLTLITQTMNEHYANQQVKDYGRLVTIEKMLETDFVKKLNHHKVYSEDLYVTKWSLAIHNNYWTHFMQNRNLNININRNKTKNQDIIVEYPNDKYMIISHKEELILISDSNLYGKKIPIKLPNKDIFINTTISHHMKMNGMYVYSFKILNDNKLTHIPYNSRYYDNLFL